MSESNSYQHLERRPGSNYKQLFVKGLRIRAEVLFRETIGAEPQSPKQVAKEYQLPLEVVQEAIEYCQKNPDVLQQDWEREEASVRAFEAQHPPILPPDYIRGK